jgi:hypothetical protein
MGAFLLTFILALGSIFGGSAEQQPVVTRQSKVARPESNSRVDHRSAPHGEWVAVGHVLLAEGIANQSTGEVLSRNWLFAKVCDRTDRCPLMFERVSALGTQKTRLVSKGGSWTAYFGPLRDQCENFSGRPGHYTARFTIRWAPNGHLVADERSRYGGRCDPGRAIIRWTAFRKPSSGAAA